MSSKRNETNQVLPPVDLGKWVRLENAKGCVSAAARLTLTTRLAAVLDHLPQAGGRSKDSIEHVHQLRVSTRRVIAALQLYQEVLPRKQTRWMSNQMKRIRQVAGVARDLDVLSLRYRQTNARKRKRLMRRLIPLRREARQGIMLLNHRLIDDDRLARRASKLLQSISCTSSLKLDEFARVQLTERSRRFFKNAKRDLDRVDRLHQFRIQAKKLRYTIELLGDVLPSDVRTKIYPVVCKVQDMLGELNDHSIARERMKRLARKTTKPRHAKQFTEFGKAEKRKMEQAKLDFREWWTPRLSEQLECSVKRILQVP